MTDRIQVTGDGNVIGDNSYAFVVKQYSRSEREALLDFMSRAVAEFERDSYSQRRQRPSLHRPYKSLHAFEVADRDLYFGREAAVQEVYERVTDQRLTVLYGRSGAGKTSLLKAGLSPRLVGEGRLPVYVRTRIYNDPVEAVKIALAPRPWPETLSSLSLDGFLRLACGHLSRDTQELVIILDQFEYFLVSLPELIPSFADTLATCYDQQSLQVRFLISLRQDHRQTLNAFSQQIPEIMHHHYGLPPMREAEAVDAITKPLAQIQRPCRFEPVLITRLLDDLGRNDVELPHLQIVCSTLFDNLPEEANVVTLEQYRALGAATGILSGYLESMLKALPGDQRMIAREVLKILVSSEATNRVLDVDTIRNTVTPGRDLIQDVLERLVNRHLLRTDEAYGLTEYELAHPYLVSEIVKWVGEDELETKRAQDLLQHELATWRLHETPLDREQLDILRDHVEHLRLGEDAHTLLLYSAVYHGHEIAFWWGRLKDQSAALQDIPFEKLAGHLAEDLGLCKTLSAELASAPFLAFRASLLEALWDRLHQTERREHRETSRALWALRAWLSRDETMPLIRTLLPFWGLRYGSYTLALVISVLLVAGIAPLVLRVHALPGQWVTIPEGDFVMGCDAQEAERAYELCQDGALEPDKCSDPDALLVWAGRKVQTSLPQFAIMENEVTNAQYRQCLHSGSCEMQDEWDYDPKHANRPATNLNWHEAAAYCAWLGGRLPTEGEWEKAARGVEGYVFPWNNEWEASNANLEHYGKGSAQSVDRYGKTDRSGYEVINLAGNVREWTATVFDPEADSAEGSVFDNTVSSPDDLDQSSPVILRGGSWENERSTGMTFRRGLDAGTSRRASVGFRCVCPEGQTCEAPWSRWWIWFGNY